MIILGDSETCENFPVVEPAIVHVDVGVACVVVSVGHEQVGHLPEQPLARRGKEGISNMNYRVFESIKDNAAQG